MGMTAASQLQARAKARARRIAVEHDRVARDQRVEDATVVAIGALGDREAALGQVRACEVRVGHALRAITAEGITVDGAARLCDLTAGEARSLRRSAREAQDCLVGAEVADPDPGGPPDVRRRPVDDWAAGRPAAGLAQAPMEQPGARARPRFHVDVL